MADGFVVGKGEGFADPVFVAEGDVEGVVDGEDDAGVGDA